MILVPFFAISTAFGFTKNLLSFPFQAPVFFSLAQQAESIRGVAKKLCSFSNFDPFKDLN